MPIATCARCNRLYHEPDTDTADEPGWLAAAGGSRRRCPTCAARERNAPDASLSDLEPYPYASTRAPVANGG